MPDQTPVQPAPIPLFQPTTNPLAAGHTTTEYFLAKVTVYAGVAGAVLGAAAIALSAASTSLPPAAGEVGKWVTIAGATVATLSSAAYGFQRALLKIAAIKSGNGG